MCFLKPITLVIKARSASQFLQAIVSTGQVCLAVYGNSLFERPGLKLGRLIEFYLKKETEGSWTSLSKVKKLPWVKACAAQFSRTWGVS